jgi:RimJ/RimL family protein N-acetyltransferase
MQLHVQALYQHDETLRMTSINDWHGGVAPRFFLGRTDRGNVWRSRNDVSRDICDALDTVCQAEPPATLEEPTHATAFQRILSAPARIDTLWRDPAYWFPYEAAPARHVVPIDEQRAHLLAGGLSDWTPDSPYQQPFVAVIVEGRAVAVCASVRITDNAHEAGVETLATHRRRGYAVTAVSTWAHLVQKRGALALYSTSFDNVASQRVAARLGLSMYGVDFHIT